MSVGGTETADGAGPENGSRAAGRSPEAPPPEPGGRDGAPSATGVPGADPGPRHGIRALSLPYRMALGACGALIAFAALVHLGMVFLHVAPANTVSKEYGETIDAWIYPEFEQNWKLFAPNPLQQNISVQVRADVRAADGARTTTGWIDLTARDTAAIRGNPFPSHTDQNALRRAWDLYVNTHDDKNRATGPRGALAERYVRRIAMSRLEERELGGTVERIRLRSATRLVPAPPWSEERTETRTFYRVLPWWTVTRADLPAGVDNGRMREMANRETAQRELGAAG
ncbi:DUF5819 family protein [Streptomyces sp. NPDC057638]|uniref:DUF5819 family protein n=1 Tax=Streptomyces sp. NPDC057638 TaxID=3346190 RepID=UPI0036C69674